MEGYATAGFSTAAEKPEIDYSKVLERFLPDYIRSQEGLVNTLSNIIFREFDLEINIYKANNGSNREFEKKEQRFTVADDKIVTLCNKICPLTPHFYKEIEGLLKDYYQQLQQAVGVQEINFDLLAKNLSLELIVTSLEEILIDSTSTDEDGITAKQKNTFTVLFMLNLLGINPFDIYGDETDDQNTQVTLGYATLTKTVDVKDENTIYLKVSEALLNIFKVAGDGSDKAEQEGQSDEESTEENNSKGETKTQFFDRVIQTYIQILRGKTDQKLLNPEGIYKTLGNDIYMKSERVGAGWFAFLIIIILSVSGTTFYLANKASQPTQNQNPNRQTTEQSD